MIAYVAILVTSAILSFLSLHKATSSGHNKCYTEPVSLALKEHINDEEK